MHLALLAKQICPNNESTKSIARWASKYPWTRKKVCINTNLLLRMKLSRAKILVMALRAQSVEFFPLHKAYCSVCFYSLGPTGCFKQGEYTGRECKEMTFVRSRCEAEILQQKSEPNMSPLHLLVHTHLSKIYFKVWILLLFPDVFKKNLLKHWKVLQLKGIWVTEQRTVTSWYFSLQTVFTDTYRTHLAPIPLPFLPTPYTLKCLCIHMAKHLKPHSMG